MNILCHPQVMKTVSAMCVCVCVCVSSADTCNSAHAVQDTQEDKDISFEKDCGKKKSR